jgi:hypothetical protein
MVHPWPLACDVKRGGVGAPAAHLADHDRAGANDHDLLEVLALLDLEFGAQCAMFLGTERLRHATAGAGVSACQGMRGLLGAVRVRGQFRSLTPRKSLRTSLMAACQGRTPLPESARTCSCVGGSMGRRPPNAGG